MAENTILASQVAIKVDGTDVDQPVMAHLMGLTVDQHAHLPTMFTLHFQDTSLELLDKGPFNLTKEVEILAQKADGSMVSLVCGEITALEPEFREGMVAELVVRGYDKLHRLFREKNTKTYLNTKDSDIASEIARNSGLQDQVETTSTVYSHLFQHNQTDLEFLAERAWRIGFECFADGSNLYFRKPPSGSASVNLTWGDDLLTFRPRITLAEQVDEVLVKAWDPEKQQAIVGRAQNGELYPQVQESKNGAQWASNFGNGKMVIVDIPVATQAEADTLAAARMDEISGAYIEAEGAALKRPDIRAGQFVNLAALGERFSGTYLVTSANHLYTSTGLKTVFQVSGTRTGLLTEQLTSEEPQQRVHGVVIGIVTNTDDPNQWGRVKLKFPWLDEDSESDWARVMGIGAGPGAGLFVVPAVGDEVLVAFDHGDFSRPCVLGGLWNGQSQPPNEGVNAGQGEKPLVRTWHSINGHRIVLYDDSNKKIEIVSTDGRSITLDDQNKKITLKTSGVEVTLEDNNLTVQSQGNISVNASGNLELKASGNIDIEADGMVNVKGNPINLN